MAFSEDGKHVLSGSLDGSIRLWRVMTGEIMASKFSGNSSNGVSSPDGTCIPPVCLAVGLLHVNTMIGDTDTTYVGFADDSTINEEGWICGSNGELLMWIPPTHRANLHRPSTIWITGKDETLLDLSSFVHGRRWAACANNQSEVF